MLFRVLCGYTYTTKNTHCKNSTIFFGENTNQWAPPLGSFCGDSKQRQFMFLLDRGDLVHSHHFPPCAAIHQSSVHLQLFKR